MGSVHQSSELSHISGFQNLYGPFGTLVLVNGMAGTAHANFASDGALVFLELFLGQITQSLDINDFLKLSQSLLTLCAALVVFGIAKSTLLVAAGDDDLHALQFDRCVLVLEVAGIKIDGVVFFTHGNGELIHDTAVDTVEIILCELAVKRDVNVGNAFHSIHVTQSHSGQHMYGR